MIVEAQTLEVSSDGIPLNAEIYRPRDPRGVVVLLHGIPSVAPPDPADPGYPGLARVLAERGWSAAWGDMRAVRGSGGYFSIEGWVRDAIALVDAARRAAGSGLPTALIGSSAGGAVATEATRRGAPVDALALLAAPAEWLSFASDPVAGVQRVTGDAGMALAPDVVADATAWAAEFEAVTTVDAVADIAVPVLIVHGTNDDTVPVEHAHLIAKRAPNARLEIIDDGLHQLRRDDRVVGLLLEWLDEVLA